LLAQAIDNGEAQQQPVRIIAHSMGGLGVRALLADPDGQARWKRMCVNPAARFIMLGTPNGGSHAIASMLIGRDALVRKWSYPRTVDTLPGDFIASNGSGAS